MSDENGKYYWKRVGHVEIGDGDGNVFSYGTGDNALDFRFNIKKPLAAVRVEANIGILGLSRETIHKFASWQPWNVAVAKERPIKVYGGYESDIVNGEEPLLFEGYIVEAKPTQPPNMWLNIKADNLSYAEKKIVQKNVKEKIGFKQYVKELASSCGWLADIAPDIDDKTLNRVCFIGSADKVPEYVESLANVYAYVSSVDTSNGKSASGTKGVLKVVRRIVKNYPSERGIFKLTADTGLLGIAAMTWDSLTARMRLDTQIELNDFVWVQSELYPSNATGAYLVNTVEYNGHFRGQEWETVIHAWNFTPESMNVRGNNYTGGKS